MDNSHDPGEIAALETLAELHGVLVAARDSVTETTLFEGAYAVWVARSIISAVDGYLLLRHQGKNAASKLLVRPAIEFAMKATAVCVKPGLFYRLAYNELQEERKVFAKRPEQVAEADKAIAELESNLSRERPGYRFDRTPLSFRQVTKAAGLRPVYDMWATYCKHTHGALLSHTGDLDELTDKFDTHAMCWSALLILDMMKKYTAAKVPELAPYHDRFPSSASP